MQEAAEFSKIIKIFEELSSNDEDLSVKFSEQKIKEILKKSTSSVENQKRLEEEFLGVGPIYSLIQDARVTEIIIDGADRICFEKEGELFHHEDHFLSKFTFENFIHRLCEEAKITPCLKNPYGDGRWKNFRIHVIKSPLTHQSYHLTLRRHPQDAWTFDKLEKNYWAPPFAISILKNLIKKKFNILIAGPTSSGKTSVLNACLLEIESTQRVISIEDVDELICPNIFSVKLLTRLGSSQLNPIDQSILVRQSLRMRPDRIVMGEVRGPEAKDLIMALATGHLGSMGTIHAHHHKQALLRLTMLIQSANSSWNNESINNLIHLGIHAILMVDKIDGKRKLKGIYQITGLEKTGFLFDPLFQDDSKFPQTTLVDRRWGLGH